MLKNYTSKIIHIIIIAFLNLRLFFFFLIREKLAKSLELRLKKDELQQERYAALLQTISNEKKTWLQPNNIYLI